MNDLIYTILALPIVWFIGGLIYQILHLFYLWIKFKLDNLKELRIWD